MADVLTPEQRSKNMASIRSKDTKPEKKVRSLVHSLGYRYRLHQKDLPGKPDLVFRSRRKLIFIHGCYWHMHDCPNGRVIPKTNTDFWQAKRKSNKKRDMANLKALKLEGWKVLVIWECGIKNTEQLQEAVQQFLEL